MTDTERMRTALLVIGNNLQGNGFDFLKPMSAQMCSELADLAFAVAGGRPHEKFDAGCRDAALKTAEGK